MTLLDALLQADGNRIVAFDGQQTWKLAQLRQRAETLARQLATLPAQRWAICTGDSYHFCQALLACAMAGRAVVLPGHQRLAGLQELLDQRAFDGLLCDEQLPLPCAVLRIDADETGKALPAINPLATLAPEITLYTSGSTGQPKGITKRWPLIEAEVRTQLPLWHEQLGGVRLFSCVSHQHIYGLLFRILLPLALGIPFARRQTDYPEQLADQTEPWALVSSPAFLSRLDPALDTSGCRLVFSSGGPLAYEDARQCAALLGPLPVEIYGSSETGGIGWRQSHAPDCPWTPFAGVTVSCDEEQTLLLRSPFMDEAEPWVGSDRIAQCDDGDKGTAGRFHLLGRRDRIVKIEEKRISLDDVELRIKALEGVLDAAVLPLEQGGRQVLGAALVLSQEGMQSFTHLGHGAFLQQLRRQLRPWLEPVALPRSIRLFQALPLTGAGKRDGVALRQAFDQTPLQPQQPGAPT
ncbi:acyl-CoA synthetase [Aeromonas sobria]|uniref:AMP-binding protein n=1 Tax=Aeromonas sobria TaxID=646 RepID=UPI00111B1ED9|nr:AMP-binding protein [Aeromonas sobria]TNJ14299.1 acyl-CoA synthetase [Aeromonas sobria]